MRRGIQLQKRKNLCLCHFPLLSYKILNGQEAAHEKKGFQINEFVLGSRARVHIIEFEHLKRAPIYLNFSQIFATDFIHSEVHSAMCEPFKVIHIYFAMEYGI